jgi:hypothetical protein
VLNDTYLIVKVLSFFSGIKTFLPDFKQNYLFKIGNKKPLDKQADNNQKKVQ